MFGGLHGGGLRINRCDGILASLNNPTFSDVQVRLPSGKETLHCHRLVLAAASPVLCSNFCLLQFFTLLGLSSFVVVPNDDR